MAVVAVGSAIIAGISFAFKGGSAVSKFAFAVVIIAVITATVIGTFFAIGYVLRGTKAGEAEGTFAFAWLAAMFITVPGVLWAISWVMKQI